MNKKVKFALASATMVTVLAVYAYVIKLQEDEADLTAAQATAAVMEVYLEDGMLGLIGLSKECYANEAMLAADCLALDVAAGVLDIEATRAMKIPSEQYFYDDSVVERAIEFDKGKTLTREDAVAYSKKIKALVLDKIDDEWDKQKHKLD